MRNLKRNENITRTCAIGTVSTHGLGTLEPPRLMSIEITTSTLSSGRVDAESCTWRVADGVVVSEEEWDVVGEHVPLGVEMELGESVCVSVDEDVTSCVSLGVAELVVIIEPEID